MNITFETWTWNEVYEGVALYGNADGRGVGLLFAGEVLAELFDVPNDPLRIVNAFKWNRAFIEEIARSVIEAGKLRDHRKVILERKDLLPYFEKRAATAPA